MEREKEGIKGQAAESGMMPRGQRGARGRQGIQRGGEQRRVTCWLETAMRQ